MPRRFATSILLPADPSAALEAATKQYVDDTASALQPLDSDLTTIAALSPSNGLWLRRAGGVWTASSIAVADVSGAEATANKGAANGYAGLDSSSDVPYANLPDAIPRGRINSNKNTTQVVTSGATESITDSMSFTAVTGRRYRLTFACGWFATSGDQYYVTFRYRSGNATLLTTSTQFHRRMLGVAANNNRTALAMVADINGLTAGTTAIGVTVVRATGAGTFTRDGSADQESLLLLDDVGV